MADNIQVTRSSMPDFEEYCEEIKKLWDSHWLTNMGEEHQQLQKELEAFLDCPHVVLYTNGHLALENVIAAMQFPKGGEVITTPFTFVSTTNAISRNGLVPVFCDVNPDDYTIDVNKIESLITEKTVAIVRTTLPSGMPKTLISSGLFLSARNTRSTKLSTINKLQSIISAQKLFLVNSPGQITHF